jgi:SAM-dependent methyltransferase
VTALDLFRCPACGGRLHVSDVGASLACGGCGSVYPVVNGIPRFVPAVNYAANFGFQWNRFRRTQLDSGTGLPISRDRFQRATGWSRETLAGARVLDVGCGAGRFAEVALALGASVVAIDYSSAVDACRANLTDANLQVAQADVYALPFAPGTFDFVYSLGVIQHTPDVAKTIAALARQVKPGGELVVDVYRRHLKGWLHPRIWLRPITTRMDARRLFTLVERAAPVLLKVSNAVGAIPVAGRPLQRLVPVANYAGQLPLSPAQLEEWAILDTYDWLAPAYDQPQTAGTLQQWMTDAGLTDIRVLTADHLTARGRRPGGGA